MMVWDYELGTQHSEWSGGVGTDGEGDNTRQLF